MEGKTDFCHVYKSTSPGTYHGLVLDPSPQRFQLAGEPSTIAARSGSGKASKSRCFWIICQDLKSGQRPESDRGTVVLRVQPRASCSCPGAAVEVSSLVATLAHWWPPHNLLWTVPNTSGVALLSVWPPLALDHCFHSQFLSTEALNKAPGSVTALGCQEVHSRASGLRGQDLHCCLVSRAFVQESSSPVNVPIRKTWESPFSPTHAGLCTSDPEPVEREVHPCCWRQRHAQPCQLLLLARHLGASSQPGC